MFKRNISFYERKKEIFTKTWTLHERKSSYYEFLERRYRKESRSEYVKGIILLSLCVDMLL